MLLRTVLRGHQAAQAVQALFVLGHQGGWGTALSATDADHACACSAAALRSLLTGRILQAEGASGGSGSGGDSGSVGPDHHDASRAGPSQGPQSSPLMQLGQRLQQAAAEQQQKQQGPALPRASLPHLPGSDVADGTRTWRWYDAADEKEWQRMELARQYSDAGYAHLRHVPTSAKKMDRIVRVVRGLAVEEAQYQLKMLPHKSARYIEQALEHSLDDAEHKQLRLDNLVIGCMPWYVSHSKSNPEHLSFLLLNSRTPDTIYATKGTQYKKLTYRAKGRVNFTKSRTCHLMMLLRELPEAVAYSGFRATALPPAMLPRPEPGLPPGTPLPGPLPPAKRAMRTPSGQLLSRRKAL